MISSSKFYSDSRSKKGFLALELCTVWLPIIAIFGVILWMRFSATGYLIRQRTLDRCIYHSLKPKCSLLTALSKSNHLLRQITEALYLAEVTKDVSIVVPGLGEVMQSIGDVTMPAARMMARGIAHYQDTLVATAQITFWTGLKCGWPTVIPHPPQFKRRRTFKSTIAKVPGDLRWLGGPRTTWQSVWAWNLKVRSFGYCRPENHQTGNAWLRGEDYVVSFQNPPTKRGKALRRLWKLSSFSP